MTVIPNFLLKRAYVPGSLRPQDGGIAFDLKNVFGPGYITQVSQIQLGDTVFPTEKIRLIQADHAMAATAVTPQSPLYTPLGTLVTCWVPLESLHAGPIPVTVQVVTQEAGPVTLSVQDQLA